MAHVNECVEHTNTFHSLLSDARKKIHTAFLDLEDAFPSVPRQLVEHCMSLNHIPPTVRTYRYIRAKTVQVQ